MNRIVNFVFFMFLLGVISGCSTTNLAYKNNKLVLDVDDKHLQVDSRFISNRLNNFSILFIDQQLLKLNEGNFVVYEKARTDDMNEFYFPTLDTIEIVFDARYVSVVYFSSSFYVLQVTLADGRVLNVIVEQLEDQSLNMVYGMTNKQVNHLLKQLRSKQRVSDNQQVATINNNQGVIFSRWTTYKVEIMQLVGPKRDLMGF